MKFPRVSGYTRLETYLLQDVYVGIYEKVDQNYFAVYYNKAGKWNCLDTYADLPSAYMMILKKFGRYTDA